MVKIRLMRMGAKKRPFYRVVVADSRSPRDGRFIENIGKYHPLAHPSVMEIDEERALHWLRSGAQPSDPVRVILEKTGIWARHTGQAPSPTEEPSEPTVPPAGEATVTTGSEASTEADAASAGATEASGDGGSPAPDRA